MLGMLSHLPERYSTDASSSPCANFTWIREPGGAAAASFRMPAGLDTIAYPRSKMARGLSCESFAES